MSHANFSSGNLQVARSSKLLPACFAGQRSDERSEAASEVTTLPVEQSVPGSGLVRGQLPLPAVLPHLRQRLPRHKYPFRAVTSGFSSRVDTVMIAFSKLVCFAFSLSLE